MGRKGVSKRKPKKTRVNNKAGNSSNLPARDNSPVQMLVERHEAALNHGTSIPAGSIKKNDRGK